jgi:hypothetical protein
LQKPINIGICRRQGVARTRVYDSGHKPNGTPHGRGCQATGAFARADDELTLLLIATGIEIKAILYILGVVFSHANSKPQIVSTISGRSPRPMRHRRLKELLHSSYRVVNTATAIIIVIVNPQYHLGYVMKQGPFQIVIIMST